MGGLSVLEIHTVSVRVRLGAQEQCSTPARSADADNGIGLTNLFARLNRDFHLIQHVAVGQHLERGVQRGWADEFRVG
jgi:hypothetical protein